MVVRAGLGEDLINKLTVRWDVRSNALHQKCR